MSLGLNLINENGAVGYSTDDVTWNQVDFIYQPSYGDQTIYLPAIVNREVMVSQFFINPPPSDRAAIAHNVTTTNGYVHIWGGSVEAYLVVLMR